ncbi:melanoma antigen preferentially expressed in tumors-like [Mesoplodon densirostris]|uniref:melanoma antigen preferentially expressed in tumors-like n=1 Tax=Mesoplodon densirostris TaxID=48708 RepID=UPI0028DD3075|nr:melanoma antigen preferentially expressed in tumors-like [Mesoplodon densirostris]XP_059942416.1 melanoma antigen preferentially expressed in tumors-like [Mesoplodon densirostris]XP_059942423.1 melanoma antigen preferentially expressed in tumors-like [Mesoplodon densirostris]XP_059942424.1 melanoma antigen preferentially expressed in tumors-like [Mesoplodon densirostris]
MDQKTTVTLLELAAKSLLNNEPAAIHALDEIPRDLFVPLFNAAFLGGHKTILKAMVRVWPFRCLHIGSLNTRESHYDILEAMIDGLQMLPAKNSSSCKIQQNFGSLHVCCRNLQIDRMSGHRSILQFVDLGCIDHLEMDQANLSEVVTLLARVIHLYSLTLYNMPYKYFERRNFRSFLLCLGRLDNLQELSLSFFCLTNQLYRLLSIGTAGILNLAGGERGTLRVVPRQLDTLYLPYCSLSDRDVTVLSESSQATHLRVLSLSNNHFFSEVYEPLQTLLEKVSSTLQHLEIDNCMITDSTLSAILPALSHCTHLNFLSFAFNPITMLVLKSLLQHLTSLMKLKYVIYPVPLHCYEEGNFHDSLDRQKLAEVQAQLEAMLHGAQRDDMKWVTCDFHSTRRRFNTDVWP